MIKRRLAGRAVTGCFALCLVFLPGMAGGKSFSSSSARDGGTGMYFEDRSFGTNREGGPAFTTDPETDERRFETPPMPKKEEPEQIEIMPVYPEVRPAVPTPKPPIIIEPAIP